MEDVGFSLSTSRTELDSRAVLLGAEREELLSALDVLGGTEPGPVPIQGKAKAGSLAYLFTGQGSQRPGIGKGLYEASPLFAAALEDLFAQLDQHLGEPLKEIVFGSHPQAKELLADTAYAQPALFALEVALFRLLEAFGLAPDLLAGHSIGEIAAAHLSGVLSLSDAAKLVCARGRLMSELPGGGAMIAIEASEQEALEAIEGKEAEVSLAAINGPTSVVISGVEETVTQIAESFSAQGRKTKRLDVSHAFHSPLMEPMLAAFEEVTQSLTYNEPRIPIVSNLSGEILSAEEATDPAYWVRHAHEPVRFADAVATLDAQGAGAYLELGPDGVLSALAQQSLPPADGDEASIPVVPALRGERPEPEEAEEKKLRLELGWPPAIATEKAWRQPRQNGERSDARSDENQRAIGERREHEPQRKHRRQIVDKACGQHRLAVLRLVEAEFEHHRVHNGYRGRRQRNAGQPARVDAPVQQIIGCGGTAEERCEERDQAHRRRFLPARAQHGRIELRARKERQQDRTGAGQELDPRLVGTQRCAADDGANSQLRDDADDDLGHRGSDAQPYRQ